MFRCKECGSEYEEKPEYCDCGNDTFEEIAPQKAVSKETSGNTPTKQPTPTYPKVYPKQKISQEPKPKKTFSEQYPEFERMKQTFDPIATIVFVICLISAVVVLFFVGNPEETTEVKDKSTPAAEVQKLNIPSIDTFWNNSTSGIINNEKSKQKYTAQSVPQQQIPVNTAPVQPQPAANPQPVQQTQQSQQTQSLMSKVFGGNGSNNQTVQKPVQNSTPKPQTQKVQTQTVQTQKPQTQQKTQQQKPQQQTVHVSQPQTQKPQTVQQQTPKIPKTTQSIATQPKTTNTTSQNTSKTQTTSTASQTKPVTTQQTSKPAQTQKPKTQTTTANIPTASTMRPKATIDTQALKKELDNYKIGLRNTIGRKVDFTRVVGDGECVVAFKIASNGKLTNRSFAKQSSNYIK